MSHHHPLSKVDRQRAPGLRVRRGTVRIRESVRPRVAQPLGFASVRIFGTVRAERTRPAESLRTGSQAAPNAEPVPYGSKNSLGGPNAGRQLPVGARGEQGDRGGGLPADLDLVAVDDDLGEQEAQVALGQCLVAVQKQRPERRLEALQRGF
jgi:hypothetical protein